MTLHSAQKPITPLAETISIMAHLKAATHQAHRDLEKSICLSRLFCQDYQLQEYIQLLSSFYAFYHGLEPKLFADLPPAWWGSLHYRQKRHLLKQDLATLGVDADTCPVCPKLPPVETPSQKLGVMYVLEGSTLGGKIIRRQLASQFGSKVAHALNFYHCYGENLATEWQQYACFMHRHFDHAPAEASEQAASAALATFTHLHAWLDSASVQPN